MKTKFLLLTFVALFIVSCTIQKRQHLPGFYVQRWKVYKDGPSANKQENSDTLQIALNSGDTDLSSAEFPTVVNESEKTESTENRLPNSTELSEDLSTKYAAPKNEIQNVPADELRKPDFKIGSELIYEKNSDSKKSGKKNGTLLLALISVSMAFSVLGLMRLNRKGLLKLTRWSKANPTKTKYLIGGIHLGIMATGIVAGNNLKHLGYEFSDSVFYVFSAISTIGFLTVPFRLQKNSMALPKTMKRRKLGHLAIALSSMMMMVGFGNRISDNAVGTNSAYSVQNMDQFIYGDADYELIDHAFTPDQSEKEKNDMLRMILTGASCALGVFLIILLLCTLCAGVCLIIGAASGFFVGTEAVIMVIGGIIITVLSCVGIYFAGTLCKST